MTNIKTGIFALATILGIGSAFTTAPKTPVKLSGTTYYAITNGSGGFNWTTAHPNPALFSCQEQSAYCTIVTKGGFVPTNNVVPSTANLQSESTLGNAYRPN